MPQPDRIVLIRSGRHVQVALDLLQRQYPGCHVSVVATPNTDAPRVQAGIAESDWITYDAHAQFDAWPMLRGGLAARLWARGFDRVAVLWQDPTGSDRANVDRAATLLSPAGFDAITPDGQLIRRQTKSFVAREIANLCTSAATAAVLALALYLPAAIAALARGHRQPEAR